MCPKQKVLPIHLWRLTKKLSLNPAWWCLTATGFTFRVMSTVALTLAIDCPVVGTPSTLVKRLHDLATVQSRTQEYMWYRQCSWFSPYDNFWKPGKDSRNVRGITSQWLQVLGVCFASHLPWSLFEQAQSRSEWIDFNWNWLHHFVCTNVSLVKSALWVKNNIVE